MFNVKICGITRPEDARRPPRPAPTPSALISIRPVRGRSMLIVHVRSSLPCRRVIKVGLFVDVAAKEICRTCEALSLDMIQLHGDEPPDLLAALGDRAVMKAFRVAGIGGLKTIIAYLDVCRTHRCLPRLILLDAPLIPGFGGSGKLADWALAKQYQETCRTPPLVLAGGLKADNVAEAIRATNAGAVDTASGVESKPGIKDPAAINAIVRAARSAWELKARAGPRDIIGKGIVPIPQPPPTNPPSPVILLKAIR